MVSAARFSSVVGSVYEAGSDASLWPHALQAISDLVGTHLAGLVVQEKVTGGVLLASADPRSPSDGLADYATHYAAIDDIRNAVRRRPVGQVLTDRGLSQVIRRSECYNDFYVRWGLQHFVGSYVLNDDTHEGSLVVYRGEAKGGFTDAQIELMELLVPHVTRALQISMRLAAAAGAASELRAAFDTLATAVILLDRRGQPSWMNRAAHDLLARRDGLALRNREIVTGETRTTAALRRAIASALRTELGEFDPQHIAIPRLSGAESYAALVSPFRASEQDFATRAAAILLIVDPEARRTPVETHMRRIYGLTRAETELAMALSRGATLQEVAEARDVSLETVRSQLKQVLTKTGGRRQADVVRLVLLSPGAALRP